MGDTDLYIEVDKNNKRIGLRPISDFQTGKYIHRSSHLLVFNNKGEFLIHKRSPNKVWYPNLYTYSVSGTVKNESYKSCVNEEMIEELGINIPVKLFFVYPFFDKFDKSFHALFLGRHSGRIKPCKDEISSIK